MKSILIAIALLAGGYYYLVNYHYAPKSDKFLENYKADESNSSEANDEFEIDISQFEEKSPTEKRNSPEFDREFKINYGINEAATSTLKCDGRTRCTQMHSCEEATFFLNNCPDVMMDGDRDGIPCESQWCMRGVY